MFTNTIKARTAPFLLALTAATVLTAPANAAGILIDGFSGNQGPLSVSPLAGPLTDSSSASDIDVIGGERDLVLSTDAGTSPFSSNAEVAGGLVELANNTQFSSTLLFQWDGADGDPGALDVAGLGSVDLTSGGNNAFEIGLVFDDLPALLDMTVYSPDGSSSTVTFPGTGFIFTQVSIFIPFEAFSGSADFSDVGAIELAISSPTNGLDIAFDFVQTGVAPVPLPAGVWLLGSALLGLSGMIRRKGA